MTDDRILHRPEHDVRDRTAQVYGYGPPGRDLENLARPYGARRLWDAFVSKIFNRPLEPGENPLPTAASMRASRAFHGRFRIVPLSYLSEVAIDPPLSDEERQRKDFGVINVKLPVSGGPIVDRSFFPRLEWARENELFEVPVRVFYV